jgi:lipopolysaccharide export system protein LptA
VWTPKRILLLAAGFCLFLTAYFVYAHFLGGIDGLPPLPEDYRPIAGDFDEAAPLPQSENSANAKLRSAFGVDCKEIKDFKIKLELQKKGMVLAAGDFKIDPEGKLLLFPFSLAIFGKSNAGAQEPEINTVQSDTALLTLDKPVNNVMEMANRKIIGAELVGNIYLINNRRTPQRDDDISLFTQGPLYYQESLQLVWTDKTVRLIDLQSKPHPMTIDGTQMYVYLTKETKSADPVKAGARQPAKSESLSGVDRIELRKDVDMNLWIDAHSGFLGRDNGAQKPKAAQPAETAKPPAPPEEKVKVVIMTQGPFTYDLHTHLATYDISKISGPRPNVVTVDRINEEEGKLDHLQCDHLEMQFRQQEKPAGTAPAAPKASADNQSEGLELESARATGTEVVVTSDAEVLEAHGNDFFYDKLKGLTTLKGTPQMWALKEGNEIQAPELQLVDDKGNQQATALGEGRILMLDKATGKRPLEAQWKQRLLYAKDGSVDVLTLIGDAAFVDHDHEQELRANVLKVWLEPADPPKPGAPREPGLPRGVNAARENDQPHRKPQHLEATGNITSFGPDMHVHDTDHLVVWFKDAPVEQLPPAATKKEAAEEDPRDKLASRAMPEKPPDTLPSRTTPAAPGNEENAPASPSDSAAAAAEPAKPKKPIDLSAHSITAHVLRRGEKNDLDHLWCQGTVRVHQDPATPDEKGVDIRGDTLNLTHQVDGNILKVTGDNAQVQLDKIFILGPDVNIDQTTNEVFVKGMGIMKMPSNAKFDGTQGKQPGAPQKPPGPPQPNAKPVVPNPAETSELTVNWEKNMLFDGQKAQFFGNIRAVQDSGHLACQTMQVILDRKISLREGNKTAPPAKVKSLLCDKDVWLEDATVEGDQIASFKRMDCLVLAVENDIEKDESIAEAGGPGRVRIFQIEQKDPPPSKPGAPAGQAGSTPLPRSGTPAGAGKPKKTTEPGKPNSKDEEQHKLTSVSYQGKMIANNKIGMATFYDRVIVIDVPSEDPDLKIDENRPPKQSMYISCEKLEVLRHKLPDGSSNQEMRAYKKVVIEGEQYSGKADIVKYDQSKEQIILEGTAGNFARLYKEEVKGQEPRTIIGRKITYWRDTGKFHVEDVKEIIYGNGK